MNWSLLQNTLLVSGSATLIAMGIGIVVALCLTSLRSVVRNVFLACAVAALALPPFLVANTWMQYLGETGAWKSWFPFNLFSPPGAVLLLSLWLWPLSAVAVWTAWRRLEPAHLEAEPELRGLALIRHLLLPLARGPLLVAGLITFVLAANNLTIPVLTQVKVYPAEVWLSFSSTFWSKPDGSFDWATAAGLIWPLLLLPVGLIWWLSRREVPWPALRGGTSAKHFRDSLGLGWVTGATILTFVVCGTSLGLPMVQLLTSADAWNQLPSAVAAGQGAVWNSIWFSTGTATLCVGLAIVGALLAPKRGLILGTICRRNAGSPLAALLWLPFLVPGVLLGIGLIQLLNRPWTAWFYQSAGVVILALSLRYLAVGWSIARRAVRTADADLVDAARLEGGNTWQVFRVAQWPQIAPQLGAAWIIIFLLCLWDVETLVLIIPPGGETVALRVFNMLHYGHTAHVNALCLVLLGLAVAPLILVAALVRMRTLFTRGRSVRTLASLAAVVAGMLVCAGCSPGLAPNEARVDSQFFDRVQIIATRGIGAGQVNKPRSVAVDHDDNLYVLDYTGRVQKFGPDGKFLMLWQMPDTKRGNPKGLSIDPEGNVIVTEPHYSRVDLYTTTGKLLMRFGEHGTNTGQLMFPRATVVNSKHEWFICEFGIVDRVQKFVPIETNGAMTLQFVASYGKAGDQPGEFNRAEGLCLDAQDHLLVTDACNHRIQVMSRDGKVIRTYGKPGSGPGELSYPYDICVDTNGYQYVCEFGNSRIQIFDPQGHSVEILGGPGAAPGMFNNPWGVALDSHGDLYVADSQNHRIQKFIRKGVEVAGRRGPAVRRDRSSLSFAPAGAEQNPRDAGATRTDAQTPLALADSTIRNPQSAIRN